MSALNKAEVSLVAPFFALSPIILLFIGPLVSGDELSLLGIVGVMLTVIGSIGLFPIRPSKASFATLKRQANLQGIGMAIVSSVFFALNTLFDRLAVQRASIFVSAAAMTAAATIPFIIPVICFEDRRRAFVKEKSLFHLRGILQLASMTLKLSALAGLSGAYVAGLMRLSVLATIIGGRIFFDEQETRRRLAWGSLICFGSILIILG
jgi:drug/metabolite transporter (DMT)-like permease